MLLLIYIFTRQNVIVVTKEIEEPNIVVNTIYLAVMNQYVLINNIIDSWHETRGM